MYIAGQYYNALPIYKLWLKRVERNSYFYNNEKKNQNFKTYINFNPNYIRIYICDTIMQIKFSIESHNIV